MRKASSHGGASWTRLRGNRSPTPLRRLRCRSLCPGRSTRFEITGMSIDLPTPIALYIAAENRGDTEAMTQCFAEDAVVRDEGKTIKGLAAIKQWKAETRKKYQHKIEPLASVQRDGRIIVTSRLTGNFPGSPIDLEFAFTLDGNKIRSLDIHS